MALGQRHKQRILTTIVTASVFVLGVLLFFLLSQRLSLESTLVWTFLACIICLTGYQAYHYRFCHEHVTIVNTLTQIYAGAILSAGIVVMLLLKALLGIDIVTSYIILSATIILLVFLTVGTYDEFLETHVPKRLAHVERHEAPHAPPAGTTPQKAKRRRRPRSEQPQR